MIRTRFAPSPTGNLHIGGARTALFNWLYARHHKGVFVLRIEDTDVERSKEEYVKAILDGLTWLGIEWDEGPYYQMERMDMYREQVQKLLETGHAYKCYCTQEELEEKRKLAIKECRKPAYDRTCRDLPPSDHGDKPFAIRFKTPITGTISFDDMVRGPIRFQCEELDDLVILRSDNTPTYNFTVVIDDALMNITHIIRGDDHINNTPRQIAIYEALGYPIPRFAHVPLIHGKDKGRLSKRHGATNLIDYKEEGFHPEAFMNYLARLGWAYGDQEIFSRQEMINCFDLPNVGKSPSIFDMDKLTWLNGHYMKTMPESLVADRLIPFLRKLGVNVEAGEKLTAVVANLKERARTITEMAQMAVVYFIENVAYDEAARTKFLNAETKPVLQSFLAGFQALPSLNAEEQKILVEGIAKDQNKKLVGVAQPIRVALTGRTVSPGIFEVITILGKETVEKRIRRAIDSIS
ncbi:MAG: glutamate--tRNA ligase [Syntrophobacterales bacterium]|jgi:glutamyl-tRNA synthetase|nr:glutamate--tRNA ligase [Syntrophobacterales bacterium]